MSERLTDEQWARWDAWMKEIGPYFGYELIRAVDRELRALRSEIEALQADAVVNAAMLARQCDMAREAEVQLAEARRRLGRTQEQLIQNRRQTPLPGGVGATSTRPLRADGTVCWDDEPTDDVSDLPLREVSE